MDERKLLVISSGYPNLSGDYLAHTFVKGFVDEAKYFFSDVLVLVLLPRLPLFNDKINNRYPSDLESYSYDNVKVMYEKYPYLPLGFLKKYKGNISFRFIYKRIQEYIDSKTIIHANFTSPAGVFAYYLSRKIGNKYILTIHEDHNWLLQEVKIRSIELIKAWKNAEILIRVNKLDNRLISQFNKNVITIPNGYNHRIFKVIDKDLCRERLNIDKYKKIIVNIGFYNEQKNQKLLIESIDLLPKEIKNNLKCFIIGGGSKENELKSLVEKKRLKGVIIIVGQVNQESLPIYLNAADIFCLSSNSEGNPTVMFEALGVGIPYIGTNVGGIPEIINSEKYGYHCEPNNIIELKKIIEKGLKKEWDRDVILKYSKQFTWENIFVKTKEYY